MTKEEAIEELLFQSTAHTDVENPRWENGFLGSLRPFQGKLIEDNFHLIVKALFVLADEFEQQKVDSQIVSAVWSICFLGRDWAVSSDGMLRSNNLITSEQVAQIENWIWHISNIFFWLLEGMGKAVAFEFYEYQKSLE